MTVAAEITREERIERYIILDAFDLLVRNLASGPLVALDPDYAIERADARLSAEDFEALWPVSARPDDGDWPCGDPEFEEASHRVDLLAARMFLAVAREQDYLLHWADHYLKLAAARRADA